MVWCPISANLTTSCFHISRKNSSSSFTKGVAKVARGLRCWVGVETIPYIPASDRAASVPGGECSQQPGTCTASGHGIFYRPRAHYHVYWPPCLPPGQPGPRRVSVRGPSALGLASG